MAAFKYLSEALPHALKALGWSQRDLAERCQLPASQINRYCKGVNHPPLESFEKLLTALPEDQHGPVSVAYLRDCMPPSYRSVVEIHPASLRVAEEPRAPILPGIDPDLDRLLRIYADLAMRHTEVRTMLRSYLSAVGAVGGPSQSQGQSGR